MKLGLRREGYDKEYYRSTFNFETLNSSRNKNRLEELLRYKAKGRLLEVGCGRGYFLKAAESHFDIEGVDVSDYAIMEAAKILPGARVRVGDITKDKVKKEAYDVMVAFNVLEHVEDPGLILKEIRGALKGEGVLFFSVPYNSGLVGKMFTLSVNFFDKTHCSTLKPKEWLKILDNLDFKVVDVFGETILNRNTNLFIKGRLAKYFSFNLMILCKKQ